MTLFRGIVTTCKKPNYQAEEMLVERGKSEENSSPSVSGAAVDDRTNDGRRAAESSLMEPRRQAKHPALEESKVWRE